MQFGFEATCVLVLDYDPRMQKSKHIHTKFRLDMSPNLDRRKYLNIDGRMTMDGVKAFTNATIHGLVGNIHYAHEKSLWDSAEHLRYIIEELEKGFAAVATVENSTF